MLTYKKGCVAIKPGKPGNGRQPTVSKQLTDSHSTGRPDTDRETRDQHGRRGKLCLRPRTPTTSTPTTSIKSSLSRFIKVRKRHPARPRTRPKSSSRRKRRSWMATHVDRWRLPATRDVARASHLEVGEFALTNRIAARRIDLKASGATRASHDPLGYGPQAIHFSIRAFSRLDVTHDRELSDQFTESKETLKWLHIPLLTWLL